MKKHLFLQGNCSLLLCVLLFVSVALTACKGLGKTKTASTVVQPGEALMRAFSQSPPVINQVFIRKLDKPDKAGNTVVLIAELAPEETRLRGINTWPLIIDEKTSFTLNDRGIDGDDKSGDNRFSVALAVSDEELAAVIRNNQEVLAKQNNTIISFAGRVRKVERDLRIISLDSFRLHTLQPIRLFFLSRVTRSVMDDIRNKSLMVTHTSVVEDLNRTYDPCRPGNKGNADGVWSFKTLITNMANEPVTGVTPKQFLIDWVDNFLFSQHNLSSTDASTNRLLSKERLIKAWMGNSGVSVPGDAGVPTGWQTTALKVEEFPVRLLAIVNRLDLRGNPAYGGGFLNAGEGRFVFAFVDSENGCANSANGPGTMTFILEYGIPIRGCEALKAYGQRWWDLQSQEFGEDFNSTLEGITQVFTAANANTARPNRSALNHFRTNDFLPADVNIDVNPWVIRDFEIDGGSHKLKMIHPNHEPMVSSNAFHASFNLTKLTAMVTFANNVNFTPANPNPNYTIPDDIKGINAPMRVLPGIQMARRYHWTGNADTMIDPFKRREFSLGTCSGCHRGETRTDFTHVRPRDLGAAAELSGFMTGLGLDDNSTDVDTDPTGEWLVNDPGNPALAQKGFNDAFFRARSLEDLVFNSPCIGKPGFPRDLFVIERVLRLRPLNMPH